MWRTVGDDARTLKGERIGKLLPHIYIKRPGVIVALSLQVYGKP